MKTRMVSLCESCKFFKKGVRFNFKCAGGYFVDSCSQYSYDRVRVEGVQLSLFERVK